MCYDCKKNGVGLYRVINLKYFQIKDVIHVERQVRDLKIKILSQLLSMTRKHNNLSMFFLAQHRRYTNNLRYNGKHIYLEFCIHVCLLIKKHINLEKNLFQQGNYPKHTSKNFKEYCSVKGIKKIEWLAHSTNLNQIGIFWGVVRLMQLIKYYKKTESQF